MAENTKKEDYDFNTGRTDRVNAGEQPLSDNAKETDALREKIANEPGTHAEGQYDKQSDRDEMSHDETNNK